MMPWRRKIFIGTAMVVVLIFSVFIWHTWTDLQPPPDSLVPHAGTLKRMQFLDRDGHPLTITYQNRWNLHDYRPLHAIPSLLQQAFIVSEDKRFYDHHGVDWLARAHALWHNLKAWDAVRGASTITEQVIRLLHPRPRTLWSRWLEGLEAARLGRRFSKAEVLEFYLNQVPYAHQHRGVVQAARHYFDRELDTLDLKETLALAVLVRAPTRFDLRRDSESIIVPMQRLARRMMAAHSIDSADFAAMDLETFELARSQLPVEAAHFVGQLRIKNYLPVDHNGRVLTTLDGELQTRVQALLNTRLRDLRSRNVTDGAVLVVDHETNEILAWVNGGDFDSHQFGAQIDAITQPRQPGSTLKPFLYAMALEKGWHAATLINDTPLFQRVGGGLHNFHNYSRQYYGPLRLRDVLANSLNTPAVRTMSFVKREVFLQGLRHLGFHSLDKHPDHYGDGLALGNGEVTLLELVRAYATLARGGRYQPLRMALGDIATTDDAQGVFSEEVSSLIADILSDPDARRLEFGRGHLLHFPVQTAVKTGTSNDYRDAWALGFSSRHTVGVWMGNLDQSLMQKVSGSIGPALVLRAVFAELNRHAAPQSLALSRKLQAHRICRISGKQATPRCPSMIEWFRADTFDGRHCPLHTSSESSATLEQEIYTDSASELRLIQPTAGLQIAMDPRIPDALEVLPFKLPEHIIPKRVDWFVDDRLIARSSDGQSEFLWPVTKGHHSVHARVWIHQTDDPLLTPSVKFTVK